jgi:hypothetical protein
MIKVRKREGDAKENGESIRQKTINRRVKDYKREPDAWGFCFNTINTSHSQQRYQH